MSTLGQGIENIRRLDCPDPEDYHRIDPPRVSNSALKQFSEDPEACWEECFAPPELRFHREPTASMEWGLAFEKLVFYDRLDAVVIPGDVLNADGHRKGAKWTEYKNRMAEQHGPAMPLYKQDEWDAKVAPLLVARDKARSHDAAAKLLWGEGEAHVCLAWEDTSTGVSIPWKSQLDIWHSRNIIVDLKSIRQDALGARQALAAYILKWKQHWQAWIYKHAMKALAGKDMPFVFVYVGNHRPHGVQVVEMTDPWMELAENQVRTTMGMLSQAWQSGIWKPAGFGEIQHIDPPRWASSWLEDSWAFQSE